MNFIINIRKIINDCDSSLLLLPGGDWIWILKEGEQAWQEIVWVLVKYCVYSAYLCVF